MIVPGLPELSLPFYSKHGAALDVLAEAAMVRLEKEAAAGRDDMQGLANIFAVISLEELAKYVGRMETLLVYPKEPFVAHEEVIKRSGALGDVMVEAAGLSGRRLREPFRVAQKKDGDEGCED